MKILVLRFSSIGDIVLTTPVLRCLKTQFPEHQIHYATKERFKSLLINNPYLDKIHVLKDNLLELTNELKKEKFDLIIDLHNNLRTMNIWSILRVKRIKFDKINWEKWLMVKLKVNILPYYHIVDRYLDTLSELGVENDGKGLDYFIPSSCDIKRLELPNTYWVYAIGGQHETKKLPFSKQVELLSKSKKTIVLIGGKEDKERGEALQKTCENTINLCGDLSIDESAKLIFESEKVISHDTGMMHIAAALKKPIVSIWGNTIPEFGMYPYYPESFDLSENQFLEVSDLSCRPCSKIGYKTCPKGHFKCMEDLKFDKIFENQSI